MGLDKTLTSLIINSTKNFSKFELSILSLKDRFKLGCPTKDEILNIINKKNQISSILSQSQSQIQILQKTNNTLETTTSTFTTLFKTIKSIPAPTAIAGVGVPFSALTGLSSALDVVNDRLKQSNGILKSIPSISNILNDYLDKINKNLNELDNLILNCLKKQIDELSDEEKENYLSNLDTEIKDNVGQVIDENKLPNIEGFILTIEYDPLNKFSFPRRRIRAKKNNINILGEYSYSSSISILIDEIKFKIKNFKN